MPSNAGAVRSRKRRSSRFKLKIPLVVQVGSLLLEGETTCVSKHGANIRIISASRQLSRGDLIQVVVRAQQQGQLARVVWVDPTSASGLGIELEQGGNLWGVHFPSKAGEEWRPAPKSAPRGKDPALPASISTVFTPVANESALPIATHVTPGPPEHAAATPEPGEGEISSTLPATITGISAVRLPLSESVEVVFTRPNEANVLLRNPVAPGTILRLLFGNERVMMGRVASIGRKREAGKWRVGITCDAPSS